MWPEAQARPCRAASKVARPAPRCVAAKTILSPHGEVVLPMGAPLCDVAAWFD